VIKPKVLNDIAPKKPDSAHAASHVAVGVPISKSARLQLFSASEWEGFVEEWASSLKARYFAVKRHGGAGDKGIDVAAFTDKKYFQAPWDNYQCKHYDHALRPSDIWIEIGKLVYYTFTDTVPRSYFFVAPKGVGTTLSKLLMNPTRLKESFFENWTQYCQDKLTSKGSVPLEDKLKPYAEQFNFGIFDSVSAVTLIEQHATTPFHAVRFGGGLPMRPLPGVPPPNVQPRESRYVEQLYGVYSEAAGRQLNSRALLATAPVLEQDFQRQRERFYCAEALRNFARDNVPEGAYEALKEETYHGVIDTCENSHPTSLARLRETLNQSVAR
jgi:C-terminal domain 6 of the ABC-three component (ABC-3C) systems